MKLTQKQETFCLKYFELGNATEAALIAGYSPKTARAIASINLTKADIQARLKELNQNTEDASIATVTERKQRLTELAKEDNEGKFGFQRQPNISAIAELNKMEKVYTENTVNVDNRTLNIIVNSEKAKELTQKLIEGERTE